MRLRHRHQETNILVEKLNSAVTSTIAAYVESEHSDSEEIFRKLFYNINNSTQITLEITPFEFVCGRTAIFPHEIAFPGPTTEVRPKDIRTC